jgi:ABC-type polysaccharide/polyol phosphate export permease
MSPETVRVTAAPAKSLAKLRELWAARELLYNLVGKELKVRYKQSALGFVWSLLTPLLMTGVFTVVFARFLRIEVGPRGTFATFFLSGYLVWQFFSNSVNSAVTSIVGNGPLIRKVYFPREILPLSLVLSHSVHLLLALIATAPLFVLQRGVHLESLPALALGLVLLVAFTSGMSMIFAAANVGFRDLQEIIQVLFLAWFYATPIIYASFFVEENARTFVPILRANPMTWFVELFHATLYGSEITRTAATAPGWPPAAQWAMCTAWAVVALVVGYWLFNRLAVTFAKEV